MDEKPTVKLKWEIDKNLDDFKSLVKNLKDEGQVSRAEAVHYLIQRIKYLENKKA